MITFNTDGMVAQSFPFPAPVMDYILKNLQPQHLVKLYKCCKFFYAKYRQNIIQNLVIVDDGKAETFDPNTTIIRASNSALAKLKDFWISDSFVYSAPKNPKIMPSFSRCTRLNQGAISFSKPATHFVLLPCVSGVWRSTLKHFSFKVVCTIKKLEACDGLIWKEYEALTKAGTIQELKVGEILDNHHLVSIDKIVAQVPNATSIEITEIILSSTSFAALSGLNHQVKITKFALNHIYDRHNFNIDLLFEFLSKNGDPDCKVHFDFYMEFFIDEELKHLGIKYANIIAEKLQAKKKELALEESTLIQ